MGIPLRTYIENILALTVTLGFFGVVGAVMYWPPGAENATLQQLIGALTLAFGGVISYFFGSSTSSKQKDETITRMTEAAVGAPVTNGKTTATTIPSGVTAP